MPHILLWHRDPSHPSTNQAQPCLASETRDQARSGWYGHRLSDPCPTAAGVTLANWLQKRGASPHRMSRHTGNLRTQESPDS